MLRKVRYTCLVLLSCFTLLGQDLKTDLSHQIYLLRNNKYSSINSQILLKYDNKILLDSLKRYDTDTSLNIRFNIQLLEFKISLNNPSDTAIRNEVISRLILGIKDKDELIRQNAIKKLLTFSYLDFDKKSINSLNQIIKTSKSTKDLILLIGVANIQEEKDYLLKNVKTYPLNKLSDFYSINWAMHLALARMGYTENIKYCIKNVENYKDTITRVTLLLNEISYIRRDTAVIYLKKYLYNNNRLPSVEGILKGSLYCQYAMDALANMLIDFPIKAQGIGYTDEEIAVARNWMENQKTYKIKR